MAFPLLGLLSALFTGGSTAATAGTIATVATLAAASKNPSSVNSAIAGGKQKQDGSHDHRTNKGKDRTPAQKEGDKARRKGGDSD